jgi:tetratricopeptide (TPR) repeat protein
MIADSALCPCGSGLRRARCCELDLSTLGTPGPPRHLAPTIERAVQAHRRGQPDIAESLCLEILDLVPDQTDLLLLLFEIRRAQDKPLAAEALLRRAVAIDPENFWANNELTLMLMGSGNLADAERHARHAVRIQPEHAQSHNLMGMVLTEANRPQMGEHHYRQALLLWRTRDPILLANLAWSLKEQGRMDEARALYRESASAAPDILQTLLGWARLEEVDRQFAAAAELLDRAERCTPRHPDVLLCRAVLLGRMRDHDAALAVFDDIARASPDGTLGPAELLEKGRLLDQMGDYDAAFAAFAASKRRAVEISGEAYRAEHAAQLASRLRAFFTASRLALLPRAGLRADTPQPLFILGFPRSGTTLVEQTLSAHSRIEAGDELPLIPEIAGIMQRLFNSPVPYPEALTELWMADHREDLDNFRDYYLQKARQLGAMQAGMPWFTDKMPLNETHLGLIGLIFPRSPMIHVVRHPLDAVLSAFSNGLNHGFFCATGLESAATHYALVMDLVAQYREAMPLPYLRVHYEQMVGAQHETVARMLDFVGEPFEEACLRFEDNRRHARTASYAQVTEKLYDRSTFRYRNYLKHLEPAIPILRQVIERLGYTI